MSDNHDLSSKYGTATQDEAQQDANHHQKWGTIDLIGGILVVIIGLIMSNESSQYAYYGIIWVGTEFILLGLTHFLFKKGYNDLNVGAKLLLTLLAAIPAVLFAIDAINNF